VDVTLSISRKVFERTLAFFCKSFFEQFGPINLVCNSTVRLSNMSSSKRKATVGIRGGHQQKRRGIASRPSDTVSAGPVLSGGWSAAGFKLLEKWAWGELSVQA